MSECSPVRKLVAMRGFLLLFVCAAVAAATTDTAITVRHKKHRRLVNSRRDTKNAHGLLAKVDSLNAERAQLTAELTQDRLEDEQLSKELKQARDNYKTLSDRFEDEEDVVASSAEREQDVLRQVKEARHATAALETQIAQMKMGIGVCFAVLAMGGVLAARLSVGRPSLKEKAFRQQTLRTAKDCSDAEAGGRVDSRTELPFAEAASLSEHHSAVALASPFHDHAWLLGPSEAVPAYSQEAEAEHDKNESMDDVANDEKSRPVARTVDLLPTLQYFSNRDVPELDRQHEPAPELKQSQLGFVDEDDDEAATEEVVLESEQADAPCVVEEVVEEPKNEEVLRSLDALRHPQRQGATVAMPVNAELRAQLDKRFMIAEGLNSESFA